jgi:hypothetical protein
MRHEEDEMSRRKTAVLGMLATTGLLTAAGPVRSFSPQPDPPRFGIVGLARDQSAVLNVVLGVPPDPGHPGCQAVLSFAGADGRTLVTSSGAEIKKLVALRGSAAKRLSFRAADVLPEGQQRLSLRAVVDLPPDPDAPSDCTGLIATVELVAPNGWTTLSQVGIAWGGPTEPAPTR